MKKYKYNLNVAMHNYELHNREIIMLKSSYIFVAFERLQIYLFSLQNYELQKKKKKCKNKKTMNCIIYNVKH